MRTAFISRLLECAAKDDRIFLITADMGYSVLEPFAAQFPNRFLNVGIAEQNAVGVAAGLANSGRTVLVYSIIPFATMRCFEQIRVDVAYQNANVKIVGVGAGLSYGPAGATHHAIEDIALMRALPGMTVVCPGDPCEVNALLPQILDHVGPVYLRLGKAGEPLVHHVDSMIRLREATKVMAGDSFAVIATSNMLHTAQQTVQTLASEGLVGSLYSMHTVKPLDTALLGRLFEKNIPVFTIEEHSMIGGLGSAVADYLAEYRSVSCKVNFRRFALPDEYTHVVGGQDYLRKHFRLDVGSLVAQIRALLSQWEVHPI